VERWRTKGLAAVLALVTVSLVVVGVVLGGSGSSADTRASAGRARLVPVSQNPLRVKGTGFRPREQVKLKVVDTAVRRLVTASSGGSFVVGFRGLDTCNGVTVKATGSRGSRASFNLSQGIFCP
jgi:hypothetical protein